VLRARHSKSTHALKRSEAIRPLYVRSLNCGYGATSSSHLRNDRQFSHCQPQIPRDCFRQYFSNLPRDFLHEDWNPAHNSWQAFSTKWRGIDDRVLHPDSQVVGLDMPDRAPCCIFIRDCYLKAEEVVWQQAVDRPRTRVILSGQPGIGKTLFLWYLLVRLLRMKQPVLLHVTRTNALLFWDTAVYTAPSDVVLLPVPLNNSASFIWSLFDFRDLQGPPNVVTDNCFPVQAPSPSDSQYKIWRKERGPLFSAFPLWTHEELTIAA